ncbi:MAG: hypothetical protein SGJ02_14150 [bacterium]|nr:hypothetical protein [bacterium]
MKLLLFVITVFSLSSTAHGLPTGSVPIDSSSTFSKSTSAGEVICALINGTYKSGKFGGIGSAYFIPFTAQAKDLKKKLKSNPALKNKHTKTKNKAKVGDIACSEGFTNPTPTPSEANFDINGNVTLVGKINFGIPTNINADVATGLTTYNSYCAGCHDPELNRSFSEYRVRIRQSPMLYDEIQLPDQQLAQIVAYLNRFNLP